MCAIIMAAAAAWQQRGLRNGSRDEGRSRGGGGPRRARGGSRSYAAPAGRCRGQQGGAGGGGAPHGRSIPDVIWRTVRAVSDPAYVDHLQRLYGGSASSTQHAGEGAAAVVADRTALHDSQKGEQLVRANYYAAFTCQSRQPTTQRRRVVGIGAPLRIGADLLCRSQYLERILWPRFCRAAIQSEVVRTVGTSSGGGGSGGSGGHNSGVLSPTLEAVLSICAVTVARLERGEAVIMGGCADDDDVDEATGGGAGTDAAQLGGMYADGSVWAVFQAAHLHSAEGDGSRRAVAHDVLRKWGSEAAVIAVQEAPADGNAGVADAAAAVDKRVQGVLTAMDKDQCCSTRWVFAELMSAVMYIALGGQVASHCDAGAGVVLRGRGGGSAAGEMQGMAPSLDERALCVKFIAEATQLVDGAVGACARAFSSRLAWASFERPVRRALLRTLFREDTCSPEQRVLLRKRGSQLRSVAKLATSVPSAGASAAAVRRVHRLWLRVFGMRQLVDDWVMRLCAWIRAASALSGSGSSPTSSGSSSRSDRHGAGASGVLYCSVVAALLVDLLSQQQTRVWVEGLLAARGFQYRVQIERLGVLQGQDLPGAVLHAWPGAKRLVNLILMVRRLMLEPLDAASGQPIPAAALHTARVAAVDRLQRTCLTWYDACGGVVSEVGSHLHAVAHASSSAVQSARVLYPFFKRLSPLGLLNVARATGALDCCADADAVTVLGSMRASSKELTGEEGDDGSGGVDAPAAKELHLWRSIWTPSALVHAALTALCPPAVLREAVPTVSRWEQYYTSSAAGEAPADASAGPATSLTSDGVLAPVEATIRAVAPAGSGTLHGQQHTEYVRGMLELPMLPSDAELWAGDSLPADERSSRGGDASSSVVMDVHRLGLQFLSLADYFSRLFDLYRRESACGIRGDVEQAIARSAPRARTHPSASASWADADAGELRSSAAFSGVVFDRVARTATPLLDPLVVTRVADPRLGERVPSHVRARVRVQLSGFEDRIVRAKWEELRAGSVVFLAAIDFGGDGGGGGARRAGADASSFRVQHGVRYVRGAVIRGVEDKHGSSADGEGRPVRGHGPVKLRGDVRILVVDLDPAVYQRDLEAGQHATVYPALNLLIRREAAANTFLPVLKTLRSLVELQSRTDAVQALPPWLESTLLGFVPDTDAPVMRVTGGRYAHYNHRQNEADGQGEGGDASEPPAPRGRVRVIDMCDTFVGLAHMQRWLLSPELPGSGPASLPVPATTAVPQFAASVEDAIAGKDLADDPFSAMGIEPFSPLADTDATTPTTAGGRRTSAQKKVLLPGIFPNMMLVDTTGASAGGARRIVFVPYALPYCHAVCAMALAAACGTFGGESDVWRAGESSHTAARLSGNSRDAAHTAGGGSHSAADGGGSRGGRSAARDRSSLRTRDRMVRRPLRNSIPYTPTQVHVLRSAVENALTLIVGPPGTGKTDVAVQAVCTLYWNAPEERILLVAHSNTALNQLFDKIACLDVPEKYLVRLGHGEGQLESTRDFSVTGRVDFMKRYRSRLLARTQRLADSLDMGLLGHADSCGRALAFFTEHLRDRLWARFICRADAWLQAARDHVISDGGGGMLLLLLRLLLRRSRLQGTLRMRSRSQSSSRKCGGKGMLWKVSPGRGGSLQMGASPMTRRMRRLQQLLHLQLLLLQSRRTADPVPSGRRMLRVLAVGSPCWRRPRLWRSSSGPWRRAPRCMRGWRPCLAKFGSVRRSRCSSRRVQRGTTL